MRVVWIVCWRGQEEELTSPAEAMDRLDQLEARGIEAEVFEVVDGHRRRLVW